ncbi:MAG: RNA polymerase sigma factor [Lachnospiraceae bacterium]|nr:RNA polymerase sigma factor [Lachnospiraceae bacterium]
MNNDEFEQFIKVNGADILRFCRMTCGSNDAGDDLYQDTMLKLLEKLDKVDNQQNVRSYALSISILLWKNKKKKYANRKRIVPMISLDSIDGSTSQAKQVYLTEGSVAIQETESAPEERILQEETCLIVQQVVAGLPEKYRIPVYLYYSANMQMSEIAEVLQIPVGTVKSRMNKAKSILKKELEALGYDR